MVVATAVVVEVVVKVIKNSDGDVGGGGVSGDFVNKIKIFFFVFTIFKYSVNNFELFSFINSNTNKFLFIFLPKEKQKNKIKIKQLTNIT